LELEFQEHVYGANGVVGRAPEPAKGALAMSRVLVVDDDRTIRELLRYALELEGYAVTAFADGLEALEALEALTEPCVVLLDYMMPRMDGLEVCHRLAESPWAAARHRVVLMSAALLPGDPCPAPACALLRKPFEVDEVYRLVADLCARLIPPPSVPVDTTLPLAG
jgi:two-component system, OmpR family, response regulator MprA